MSIRRWAIVFCSVLLATAGLTVGASGAQGAGVAAVHECASAVPAGRYTCFAEKVVSATSAGRSGARTPAAATEDGLSPANLQAAYGLTAAAASTSAKRPRVYVIDAYNAPTAEADLQVYRKHYGLPACTTDDGCFQKLNQRGAASPLPPNDEGWAGETALDLDMVSAVCPRCDITLIEADSDDNDLLAAVRTATSLGARFVSMSWGGSEDSLSTDYDKAYFPGVNGKGQGVFYGAATGDDGYAYGATYPATSPRTVAVGGTTLVTARNTRGWSETAWSDAGSGCSADESKPAYQNGIVSSCGSKLGEADMSAVADPRTGVSVYDSYPDDGWNAYGGTSAAAPIVTAAAALAGVETTTAAPTSVLYSNRSHLFDVTSGSNGSCSSAAVCKARTGWDGPTGLGTFNGLAAISPAADPSAHVVRLNYPGTKSGKVGAAVRTQLSGTSYPSAALSFSAHGLPPGVTMSKSGLLSGTPTKGGSYAPVVTATDGHGGKSSTSFRWPVTVDCSARLTVNGGFESGAKDWTASKGIVHKNAKLAYHGSHYVRLDGHGRTHTDKLSRSFAMPLGCSATLSYYQKTTTKDHGKTAHDKLRVTVDGHTVQTRTNLGAGSRYKRLTLSLTKYAGKRITVAWVGHENGSKATSFYLDNVAITLRK